ncbi:MAG TPA: hypothetical protein PLF26_10775 [Blastocatellia bacterium]|nr:hypothetical protein [Blastocatellia bacterium]
MRIVLAIGLLLVAPAAGTLARQPEDVHPGAVAAHVTVADEPAQSYALYLPSTYTADRAWPIIYCFDPGAIGSDPVEHLRAAAETYGWIVVGSNNSKNGPMKFSVEAGAAMWRDTHARFKIDDHRVYAAGFSGGARAATIAALGCGGCISGIIACGAGFPPEMSPIEKPPKDPITFSYFMTVGVDDFNFPELVTLGPVLDKLGVPNRLERFDGSHDWAPSDVMVLAVGFMETEAIRAGTRTKDAALVDAIYERAMAAAAAQQASNHTLEAYYAYSGIINQFKGLRDTTTAATAAAALKDVKAVKDGLKGEIDQVRRQQAIVSETVGYGNLRSDYEQRAIATQEFRRRIADLRAKARAETDSPDRRVARRALRQVFAWFYEGGMNLYYGGKYSLAVASLETAIEISPKWPGLYVEVARASVKGGDRKKALDAIDQAVEAGFADPERLKEEPDFEPLRDDPRFRQAVDRASSKKTSTP